jgi:FkbM family methyltransferase
MRASAGAVPYPAKRLGAWAAVLAATAVVVAGGLFWIRRAEERARCTRGGAVDEACLLRGRLVARHGPKLYSQGDEELLVRDFFQDRRAGLFVDVGASHYKDGSTTFYLEERLGWSGLAVDANRAFAAEYAQHRPRTRFFAYFVGDHEEAAHPFFIPELADVLASGDPDYVAKFQLHAREERVPAVTLDGLLTREAVTHVDFLSMDIEAGEPAALAGFDVRKYTPALVCIELQTETAPAIRRYFELNGYEELKGYALLDSINGYFAPRGGARPGRGAAVAP